MSSQVVRKYPISEDGEFCILQREDLYYILDMSTNRLIGRRFKSQHEAEVYIERREWIERIPTGGQPNLVVRRMMREALLRPPIQNTEPQKKRKWYSLRRGFKEYNKVMEEELSKS